MDLEVPAFSGWLGFRFEAGHSAMDGGSKGERLVDLMSSERRRVNASKMVGSIPTL